MNSFGKIFRVEIFGESHGKNVGVIVDGCPSGIALSEDDFTADLQRRRSGKLGTTPRIEADIPHIVSGVFNGKTCGTPITILFENTNTKSADYSNLQDHPRPGHADYTGMVKYGGYNDPRGGGHFSGRITLGLVAAGVIAKKIIAPVEICSELVEVGGRTDIDECIRETMQRHDSVGGLVTCSCKNVPVGLGEPFFDSLESEIAHIIFSIPAVKSIEFGSGIAAAKMYGSQHNDMIIDAVNFFPNLAAYAVIGADIVIKAFGNIIKGRAFDECFLMTIATLGAFFIGEYPEGVMVMFLFYLLYLDILLIF